MSETEVQNSICEYLNFKGIYFWRNNSTGVYDANANSFRRPSRYSKNGVSDILAILPDGRMLAIEVKKNSREKASKDQRKFIKSINNNGGLAFVAWTVEQVAKKLEKELKEK